jgi:ABC-type uncharacterized transport system permease subunit
MNMWQIVIIGIFSIIIGAEIGWFMTIQSKVTKIIYSIFAYIVILTILYLINNIELAIYSFSLIVIMNIIVLSIIHIEKVKKRNDN